MAADDSPENVDTRASFFFDSTLALLEFHFAKSQFSFLELASFA